IITPTFTVGCILGSIFAMSLMDRIGRSKPLVISTFIYASGALIQTFANAVFVFCIGRFISGIACGISMVISPVYIAEITPKDQRGIMGMLYNLVLQVGIFLASFCDTISLKFINGEVQWRIAVGCQLIPAVIFMVLVWFAIETPRYKLMKKKDEQALSILSRIREKPEDDKEVVSEFTEMVQKLQSDLALGIASWKEIFDNKSIFYRIIIGSTLQLLHMLVGVNAINYYSSQIYSEYLHIDTKVYGAWLVVLNNLIVVVLTIPGVKYVEKAGRRSLLVWGALILGFCMLCIFVLCLILSNASQSGIFGVICVLFIYAYCSIYSCTWGSAVHVWQSEVFPLRARSKASAICIMFQYIGSAIITGTVSILMKYLKHYTFLIFLGTCLISFVFTLLCVKETKGLSLEDATDLYSFDR
ncbi:hypothetical protein PIROE2DRAFT_29267, partial [Piromyces sp. E2]